MKDARLCLPGSRFPLRRLHHPGVHISLRDQGGQARNLAHFSGKELVFSLPLPVKLKYFVVKFG
jgi:hypothetical protein